MIGLCLALLSLTDSAIDEGLLLIVSLGYSLKLSGAFISVTSRGDT